MVELIPEALIFTHHSNATHNICINDLCDTVWKKLVVNESKSNFCVKIETL